MCLFVFYVVLRLVLMSLFFFNDTATTEIYTLSLHDALPICFHAFVFFLILRLIFCFFNSIYRNCASPTGKGSDRKSTRLNSSHANISYAVFCLKKKKRRPGTPVNWPRHSGTCSTVHTVTNRP